MRSLMNLLLGIALLLSLATGGLLHATERVCLTGEAVATDSHVHREGDADETTHGDSKIPHHHAGCQGHQVLAPALEQSENHQPALRTLVAIGVSWPGNAAPQKATLRPPIA